MRRRVLAVAAAMATMAAAVPALAQDAGPDQKLVGSLAIIDSIKPDWNACVHAPDGTDPAVKAGLCETAGAAIEKVRAEVPGRPLWQDNVFDMYLWQIEDVRALAFFAIDKTRSVRVCEGIERSFRYLRHLDPDQAEERLAETYRHAEHALDGAVKACRTDHGTPPGAPPTPA